MAKNEKLNEEAAMNLNLSQADLLMAKDVVTKADYVGAQKTEIDQKFSNEVDREKLQTFVDLGDVF
ncbi:hypothetical protein ACNQFZ_04315 [Schinkia sp. CFF1]